MSRRALATCLVILTSAVWVGPWTTGSAQQRSAESDSAAHAAVLNKYCVTCHSDKRRTGGLSLEHADLADVPKGAETWEKVIRKLRVGHDAAARHAAAGASATRRPRRLPRNRRSIAPRPSDRVPGGPPCIA